MSNNDDVIEYNGYRIEIKPDDDPQNPRTDWDNLSKMWFWHRGYCLGDNDTPKEPMREKELREYVGKPIAYITPVMMYDHSSLTIWAGLRHNPYDMQGWDTGLIGYCFVTMDDIRKEFPNASMSTLRRKAKRNALAEIEVYDQALRGDVWGYIITSEDNPDYDESCWGFFGYDECVKEAKSIVDWQVDQNNKRAWEKVEALELAGGMAE